MIPSKKKTTAAAKPQDVVDSLASVIEVLPKPIIEEAKTKSKSSKTSKLKNAGGLALSSKTNSLNIKIYEEQADGGFLELKKRIIAIDKKDYQVLMIVHDKDLKTSTDDIFVESYKKAHAHILVKKPGSPTADRAKVSTILNLLGVNFSADEEGMTLWANRGVERIQNLASAVMYLTHETEAAEKAGKEIYDRSEIVSNLSADEIEQLRDGYVRLDNSGVRVGIKGQVLLEQEAYKQGYDLIDEKEWRKTIPLSVRKSSAMREILRSYQEGLEDRLSNDRDIVRLSIFIKGDHNLGKTYAAFHSFDNTENKVYCIDDGGGTGKWDKLTPSHDVLILDDTTLYNIYSMTDNKVASVYRRNKNNAYWTGEYVIVTSNDEFESWAHKCGVGDGEAMEAIKSRFYICQIVEADGKKFLDCWSPSTRGTQSQQLNRKMKYISFRNRFNEIIDSYHPENEVIDYSDI